MKRHLSANLQKQYVLFGFEYDNDVDDLSVCINFWPITIEYWSTDVRF